MASAVVHVNTVVLLLLLFFSVCGRRGVSSLFCYALLCVLSSVAINSLGIRELFALHLLSSSRHVAVNILRLFPMVSCVGLRCVIVIFSGNTHLLFYVWRG